MTEDKNNAENQTVARQPHGEKSDEELSKATCQRKLRQRADGDGGGQRHGIRKKKQNNIIMRGGKEGKTQTTKDKQTKPNNITTP